MTPIPLIPIVAVDDEDVRDDLAARLRREGFDARTASNGRGALDLLDVLGDRRCVLLLDLVMPVMSGYEVLDHLQRRNRLGALAVIVCSTANDLHDVPTGVRYVMRKPLDVEAILRAVEETCATPPAPPSPASAAAGERRRRTPAPASSSR